MLVLSRKVGESIQIAGDIRITVTEVRAVVSDYPSMLLSPSASLDRKSSNTLPLQAPKLPRLPYPLKIKSTAKQPHLLLSAEPWGRKAPALIEIGRLFDSGGNGQSV
jgi:hypothetical protein